jgi:RNA polymerase primary sigma factor
MPRAARYRNSAFEELERQLTFAPPDALRRHMDAAEQLSHEIADDATYPFDFIVWRLTGFRSDGAAIKPVGGLTLRGDLATFALHVSERILITHDERPGGALGLAELAAELGVTEKTLRRWRQRGLIAHRIQLADGRTRVGVFRQELGRFIARHGELVGEAQGFSRMERTVASAALDRVRELVRIGQTPNLAAKRVAGEFGRSHETIRQLLLRAGDDLASQRTGASPERGRVSRRTLDRTAWERRLAYRAWRLSVPVERVAEKGGTSVDAVRRRIDAVRAEKLRGLRLTWVEFPTFERPDAAETILGSAAASTDLAERLDPTDVIAMLGVLKSERSANSGSESSEEAMLAAYNFLKRDARRRIAAFTKAPSRAEIDAIETGLRWAVRIKRRLVERMLAVAMGRVEQGGSGPLERRPADELRSLLRQCVQMVSEVIESVDPARRQTLRRLIALDTDRLVAQQPASQRASRAGVRHDVGAVSVPTLFDGVVPWSETVDPFIRVFAGLGNRRASIETTALALIMRRYGHDGHAPATLEALAAAEHTTVARITSRVAAAERALRASMAAG